MQNMITYADEYRMIDFKLKAFSETDSLILSQISYYNYEGSPMEERNFKMTLQDFLEQSSNDILQRLHTKEDDEKLIRILKMGGRHGSLRACNYVEIADADVGEQFSAITFDLGNDEYYIAFRGTDNSVTGWKEDMCLSYQKEIPAQKTAVQYATEVMNRISGRFYLGGHSKGGNLAVYSAMNLPRYLQNRLILVFNHDGPGFLEEVYESDEYRKIRAIVRKTVPQSSVVGMLLEKDDNYKVVRSSARAIQQHDPYTWYVAKGFFENTKEIDRFSFYTKQILERWLGELSFEKRKQIVELVFDTISDTGINWFNELTEERIQKIHLLIQSISETDEEERKLVLSSVRSLLRISADELQQAVAEQTNMKKEEIISFRDSVIDPAFRETLKESIDFFKRKSDN